MQAIVDDLLDEIASQGPDSRVDLVAAFAFPLPFTVICELLGVPEPDRGALGQGLTALLVPTSSPAQHARAKNASDSVVAMLEALAALYPLMTMASIPSNRGRGHLADHSATLEASTWRLLQIDGASR